MPGAYWPIVSKSLSIECRSRSQAASDNANVVGLQDSAHGAIKFDHKGKQADGVSRFTKNFSLLERPRYKVELDPSCFASVAAVINYKVTK